MPPSPSTSSSAFARRARRASPVALGALLLLSCPGPSVSVPTAPPVLDVAPESLAALPQHLPAAPDGTTPPAAVVARGLAAATHVCGAVEERQDEPTELIENLDTDAATEAWLRVDRALVFAEVAAAPSPPPSPVSVRRQALAADRDVGPGELHIHVPGTGERYRIRLYDATGRMRSEAIAEASWALRDRRANRARTIRPRVLAMLYLVGQEYDAELEVVSGYRIRGVNASQGSRHGSAEACDFRVPGVGLRTVQAFVETRFADVGVGYYPTSGFLHVDQRARTYYWIDYSGPGEPSRTRTRRIDRRGDPETDPTLRSMHITEEELYVLPPELRASGYD